MCDCALRLEYNLYITDIYLFVLDITPAATIGFLKDGLKSVLLPKIIYPSKSGIFVDNAHRGGERDMFCVAVKIQAKHETHHVKVIYYIQINIYNYIVFYKTTYFRV